TGIFGPDRRPLLPGASAMTTIRLRSVPLFVTLLTFLGELPSRADDTKPRRTMGSIERLDPRFDRLIGRDAALEVLAGGFDWVEGPVWVPDDGGYLLCSDIPKNAIIKWQEGKGKSVFLKPSGYTGTDERLREPGSNGLL